MKAKERQLQRSLKIFLICLAGFSFVCLEVYPFWIWSPKTQEWKNPKHSALATPALQYKEAVGFFDRGEFKRAFQEFRKLLANYPDSKEAAEAQYFLGLSLEQLNKPFKAYQAFQKLVQSYPNSERINEAIERKYNIGEYFLDRGDRKMLGVSIYDFVNHPSIQIFESIVEQTPHSEYAPRAQYKLGVIFFRLNRYRQAHQAFQKVLRDYPDSRWAAPAKYQLALATVKAFPGVDYDSSMLEEAAKKLDEFIEAHPEAKISKEAQEQLDKLRNREAKKIFEIAEFYQRRRRPESAEIYYNQIIDGYPDTDYYQKAEQELKKLKTP